MTEPENVQEKCSCCERPEEEFNYLGYKSFYSYKQSVIHCPSCQSFFVSAPDIMGIENPRKPTIGQKFGKWSGVSALVSVSNRMFGSVCPPYSFKIVLEFASNCAILLRTIQPVNLPGERKHEIVLKKGDIVQFSTTLDVMQREETGDRRRQITPPPERLEAYIHNRLANADFSVTSLVAGEPENVIVKKVTGPY